MSYNDLLNEFRMLKISTKMGTNPAPDVKTVDDVDFLI